MRRYVWLSASLLLLAPISASAQLEPVGAPKGTLRFDIGGMFQSADRRLLDGTGADYGTDFGSPTLGSDRIPALRATDSLLALVLGQPSYHLNLGVEQSNGQLTVGTGTIGIALGVTRKLTLFTHIPLVTTRVQTSFKLDSTAADGGINSAHPTLGNSGDQALAGQFFGNFDAALNTLDARIAGGAYAGNPQLQALAQEILARGRQTRDALQGATTDPATASPFLPTASSSTGQQIVAGIRGLQDTLSTMLGVGGFSGDPLLPADRLSQESFANVLEDPAGPYALLPLREAKISRMGDMDVGATFTVVDRFDRNDHVGGFRLAAQALLRLPTGQRDDPNNLLDVGTGNGRYELGLSGTADLGAGRWGARFTGGYLLRFATLRVRRVGPLDQPYLTSDRLTNVRLNAGDVLQLGARPFFRLTRNFAIMGVADYWHEAAGSASYPSASDSVPGLPAGLLASGSGSSLALGGGVTYVGRATGECQPGHHCGFPIDATWSYTNVFWGRGGPVNQYRSTRLEIRWYQRLWR